MSSVATRQVTLNGSPLNLSGNEVKVGHVAPDFTAVTNDLAEFKLSSVTRKKVVVLSAVPSLDTPVCDIETRRFNQEAAALGDDVQIVTISMDLPFAQKRWCGAAGVDKVVVVSDHRDASFGKAYGLLIDGLRLLARAVFVVDREGKVCHAQIVPEIAKEPDYGAILDAVRQAMK
ncbi:MAG: thiol peroxidase [Planctomycetaceae bacterium]|nr:thiol peroxidase [Planctomycetaceae bacterium]